MESRLAVATPRGGRGRAESGYSEVKNASSGYSIIISHNITHYILTGQARGQRGVSELTLRWCVQKRIGRWVSVVWLTCRDTACVRSVQSLMRRTRTAPNLSASSPGASSGASEGKERGRRNVSKEQGAFLRDKWSGQPDADTVRACRLVAGLFSGHEPGHEIAFRGRPCWTTLKFSRFNRN